MEARRTQPSGPLLVGVAGGLLGAGSAITSRILAVSEEAQFLLWLLAIALAYLLAPMIAVGLARSVPPERISTQFLTGLLLGVTAVVLGAWFVPEATLRVGWLDKLLLLSISLLAAGLTVASLICEIGASVRSETPTIIRRARSAPLVRPLGALSASWIFLGILPTIAFVVSDSLYGRVGEPFVTGALVLAFVFLPWIVFRARPRGSFEGNAILMAWGAALAVGSTWIAWFISDTVGTLQIEIWFQPLVDVGIPSAFTLWLAPGLLLSLTILARLHRDLEPGENVGTLPNLE